MSCFRRPWWLVELIRVWAIHDHHKLFHGTLVSAFHVLQPFFASSVSLNSISHVSFSLPLERNCQFVRPSSVSWLNAVSFHGSSDSFSFDCFQDFVGVYWSSGFYHSDFPHRCVGLGRGIASNFQCEMLCCGRVGGERKRVVTLTNNNISNDAQKKKKKEDDDE